MSSPTIAIIIPWFGPWPQWVDLFFHSCLCNRTVDYYIYSDQELPLLAVGAENIHFEAMSYTDYCDMASLRLHVDFHPDRSYKLCDLKPFLGFIHQNAIQQYDFWAFGDMDLVWGDIRHFYTDEILSRHDILSTHSDRLSGHLTLIRNTKHYNTLVFKIHRWKELLTSPDNHALDEIYLTRTLYPLARLLWKAHKHIFLRFRFNDDWKAYNQFCRRINNVFLNKRILLQERSTTPWIDSDMLQKKWIYRNGHVFDAATGEELIYLHFLAMKTTWKRDYYHPSVDGATISFDGIAPLPEEIHTANNQASGRHQLGIN